MNYTSNRQLLLLLLLFFWLINLNLTLMCLDLTEKLLPYSELQLLQLAAVSHCEYKADCMVYVGSRITLPRYLLKWPDF